MGTDTDDNESDFLAGRPTPGSSPVVIPAPSAFVLIGPGLLLSILCRAAGAAVGSGQARHRRTPGLQDFRYALSLSTFALFGPSTTRWSGGATYRTPSNPTWRSCSTSTWRKSSSPKRRPAGAGTRPTFERTFKFDFYQEGTLHIEVYQLETYRLLWSAKGRRRVSTPDRAEKEINQAVSWLFGKFPVGPKEDEKKK